MLKQLTSIGCTLLLCTFSVSTTWAQNTISKTTFCGKKYFQDQFQGADGKIYPLDAQTKREYVLYKCDGTSESLEDGNVVIRGKWSFDPATNTITVTQNQSKDFPAQSSAKVKTATDSTIVMEKDAGGEMVTIYYKVH